MTRLRDDGYEFVSVSELIYPDSYTINSDGMQVPISKSSVDITSDNIDEVMAQYGDAISAAGFSEEQISLAVQAIKSGGELPEEVLAVIAQQGIEIPVSVAVNTDTANSDSTEQKN